MVLKKLGEKNYALISQGVKSVGSYDPGEILFIFEEQLYTDEVKDIIKFLTWMHENQKSFGSGNYEEVFKEFLTFEKNQ